MTTSALKQLRHGVAAAVSAGLTGGFLVREAWVPRISREELAATPRVAFVSPGEQSSELASRQHVKDEQVIEVALFQAIQAPASDTAAEDAEIDDFNDRVEALKLHLMNTEIAIAGASSSRATDIARPAVVDREYAETQRIAMTVLQLSFPIVSVLG